MIDGVGDLFGRKPDIYRLQHRAHHRDRKEGFKKSVAVPVENANGLPGTHPDPVECRCKASDAFLNLPICETL